MEENKAKEAGEPHEPKAKLREDPEKATLRQELPDLKNRLNQQKKMNEDLRKTKALDRRDTNQPCLWILPGPRRRMLARHAEVKLPPWTWARCRTHNILPRSERSHTLPKRVI